MEQTQNLEALGNISGDWCIFSDVTSGAGTDLWQRIDNSSVISGAGTGQKVTKWEGATNAVSDLVMDQ